MNNIEITKKKQPRLQLSVGVIAIVDKISQFLWGEKSWSLYTSLITLWF